ncbi:MAG: hypothetical protein ACFFAN_03450 [Promethearchaeota archaeon]
MEEEEFVTKKFIDFDKNRKIFYNNLYIKDFRIVVKMPLNKKDNSKDVKIKKFDLSKYTYLLSYQ